VLSERAVDNPVVPESIPNAYRQAVISLSDPDAIPTIDCHREDVVVTQIAIVRGEARPTAAIRGERLKTVGGIIRPHPDFSPQVYAHASHECALSLVVPLQ
jgi:hypothetical protein